MASQFSIIFNKGYIMIKSIISKIKAKTVGLVVEQAIEQLNYDTFNELVDVIKERKHEIIALAEEHSEEIIEFYKKIKEA